MRSLVRMNSCATTALNILLNNSIASQFCPLYSTPQILLAQCHDMCYRIARSWMNKREKIYDCDNNEKYTNFDIRSCEELLFTKSSYFLKNNTLCDYNSNVKCVILEQESVPN